MKKIFIDIYKISRKLLYILNIFFLFLCLSLFNNCRIGKSETYHVTVKKGERIINFFNRLENNNITTKETLINICQKEPFNEYNFVPSPAANISRFEGLFKPGEYYIKIKNSNKPTSKTNEYHITLEIIKYLLEISKTRYGNLKIRNNLSLYETIILASIIEKEAVFNKYHDLIASVYINRLNKNIPLASCVVIEYALGYHRPFLLLEDIQIESPYNVYKKKGVPPTPIAFFSDKSLSSAADPVKSKYYFFVFDWTNKEVYFTEDKDSHLEKTRLSKNNFIKKYGKKLLRKKTNNLK